MKMCVRKNGVSDVFKAVGIDSGELIGFAFDLGLERVAMRKSWESSDYAYVFAVTVGFFFVL
jgi:hypothetical protein